MTMPPSDHAAEGFYSLQKNARDDVARMRTAGRHAFDTKRAAAGSSADLDALP